MINRYVGNLPPMPGVFPDCPAAVINDAGRGASLEAFTATRCGYSMGFACERTRSVQVLRRAIRQFVNQFCAYPAKFLLQLLVYEHQSFDSAT